MWHNIHPNHEILDKIYKPSKAHQKHPVVLWAQRSILHYRKIVSVTKSLAKERKRRGFDNTHKTEAILSVLEDNEPEIPNCGWNDPPKCMSNKRFSQFTN